MITPSILSIRYCSNSFAISCSSSAPILRVRRHHLQFLCWRTLKNSAVVVAGSKPQKTMCGSSLFTYREAVEETGEAVSTCWSSRDDVFCGTISFGSKGGRIASRSPFSIKAGPATGPGVNRRSAMSYQPRMEEVVHRCWKDCRISMQFVFEDLACDIRDDLGVGWR